MSPSAATLGRAYRQCLDRARRHYENFPVASRLLPARLRAPVAAIYAFARMADDIADEGDLDAATRLRLLDDCARRLDSLDDPATAGDDPVFLALADTIQRHRLPVNLLHDLLRAFRMDVTKKRYASFEELMSYCRYSANPIGRLLLRLYGRDGEDDLSRSDALCSALQLINFLQDMAQDYAENGRIYLPQDDMARCGVTERTIAERRTDAAMRALVALQLERIRVLLARGAPLAWRLPGRLGLELRLTLFGAVRVVHKLASERGDVFRRPRLGPHDWLWMAWRAVGRETGLRTED